MVSCHTSRAQGLLLHFSCSGTVATTIVLGDYRDHHCAQGLSRPPSCSGTVQTTIVLEDYSDHSRAWDGLDRPRSRTKLTTVILGVSSFTCASLGDCPDRSP